MHAAIENSAKRKSVYDKDDWCEIIKNAKAKDPKYNVHQLQQNDIFNFADLSEKTFWKGIKISQLCEIQFLSNGTINYKYGYNGDIKTAQIPKNNRELVFAYDSKLRLDKNKINDILDLLQKGLIPEKYYDFYQSLIN